jgi:hypothetical protein
VFDLDYARQRCLNSGIAAGYAFLDVHQVQFRLLFLLRKKSIECAFREHVVFRCTAVHAMHCRCSDSIATALFVNAQTGVLWGKLNTPASCQFLFTIFDCGTLPSFG